MSKGGVCACCWQLTTVYKHEHGEVCKDCIKKLKEMSRVA